MNVAALPDGLRRFALHELFPEPWRNGGGLTRQVAAGRLQLPENGAIDAWDWRISVADITADGPFSVFPGIDRKAALIRGDSLVLLADEGALQFVQLGAVHAFAGETVMASQLPNGPVRLFNVMARRGRAAARLCAHHGDAAIGIGPTDCCVLLIVRGEFRVALRHGPTRAVVEFQVHAGEGLILQDTTASLEVEAHGPDSCLVQADIQCC